MKKKWQQQSIWPFSFSIHWVITLPALRVFPRLSSAAVSWKHKVPEPLISKTPQTWAGWSAGKQTLHAALPAPDGAAVGLLRAWWGSAGALGCCDRWLSLLSCLAALTSCLKESLEVTQISDHQCPNNAVAKSLRQNVTWCCSRTHCS